MPDLNDLAFFAAVVEHQGFAAASRALKIPKSSLSRRVAALEEALGARLLQRTSRRFAVTAQGQDVLVHAKAMLEAHLKRLEGDARIIARAEPPAGADTGHVFAPTIAEVPTPDYLEREVFGPILHICRYHPKDLKTVAGKLAARGYGLTLGVHSRIEAFAEEVARLVPAGNVYINRSIIGAVVGVQPFGGEGLSGTGPKAGGPYSLIRYAAEKAISNNISAQGGDPALLNL